MSARLITAAAVLLCLVGAVACSSNDQGVGSASGSLPVSRPATHTAPQTSVAATSAAVTTPAASTSSQAPAVIQAPSTPLREGTVTSVDGSRTYDIKIWFDVQNSNNCADHAYGSPVIQYLTAHPCNALDRILATTVVNGKAVGFAQSSVSFVGNAPDVYQTAGNFASLERKDGTGNVDDLLRDGYRLPDGPSKLPSPDAFDVQSQDSGVTIVDAFYLTGKTPNNDPALLQMAQDIYLQF
jgi:hypothetical protein